MIVGVDFGTTNTRVATWDPEVRGLPDPLMIGKGGTPTMPSVVAFERAPGGQVGICAVGEDADAIEEDAPNIKVMRNIKRWALASDPSVRQTLESMPKTQLPQWTRWPPEFNPDKRCFELWGKSFPVGEIISAIISEALKRAGLQDMPLELRAACPVHSDFIYRRDMVNIFSRLGFRGKVTWVTEEPLLYVALAYSLGRLDEGSYLVYDFGGGSFDCALATVEREHDTMRLIVYAADGNPLLGGMDIDERLSKQLNYDGPPNLLRLAKEQVCLNPSGPGQSLPGGVKLSWLDMETMLKTERFIEQTVQMMMQAYQQAKLIWKRTSGGPPMGEILEENSNGVIRRTVWQLREHDMAGDVDKVLLFGGTTRIPSICQRLEKIFGADRVVAASQLFPAFSEPELTAVALAASYTAREDYVPLYVNRLPCRVVLHLRQASGEQKTEYVPYFRLPWRPTAPYISTTLRLSFGESAQYQATVEDADGGVLHSTGWREARIPSCGAHANRLRIVFDRFGRLWLQMEAGWESAPAINELVELLEMPPWQTSAQRTALQRMWKIQREYEESERSRTLRNLTRNPFGWGEDVG